MRIYRCFQLPSQTASFDWWSLPSSAEVGATVTFCDGTLWIFMQKVKARQNSHIPASKTSLTSAFYTKFQETASLLEEDADSDSFVVDNVEPAAVASLFSLDGDLEGLEVHSARFLETDANCMVSVRSIC